MKKSTIYISLCTLAAAAGLVFAAGNLRAQDEVSAKPRELMMRKLEHADGILAGLTMNDFDRIREEAQALSLISLEAHWRTDLPLSYGQYNSDFQWAVGGLIQMAEHKNIEGATLKYTQVVMSCVECHTAVRGTGQVAQLNSRPSVSIAID